MSSHQSSYSLSTSGFPSPLSTPGRSNPVSPPPQQPRNTATVAPSIPPRFYRCTSDKARTKYSRHEGFRARNGSTILSNSQIMAKFARSHLEGVTNISSPYISVYDSKDQAIAFAQYMNQPLPADEHLFVVEIDTRRLGRGPIIRADSYLDLDQIADPVEKWMHQGEYLLQYTIPAEAILAEIRV